MEPDFWHARWQQNQIGFHQGQVNPYLQQHWQALAVPSPARVLVPLCGKSLDLLWLRQQGYSVEGIELSELAIRAFLEENGIEATPRKHGDFLVWESDGLRLWCGDFFRLDTNMLGSVQAIYDRAALIALPAPMRSQYVDHLQKLAGTVPHFLVTLEYPQAKMDGPPFSVDEAEVHNLFESRYLGTEPRTRHDVLSESARFQQRGLNQLDECVYLLQARN